MRTMRSASVRQAWATSRWAVSTLLSVAAIAANAAPLAVLSIDVDATSTSTVAAPRGFDSGTPAGVGRSLWQFDHRKAQALGPFARRGHHPIRFDETTVDAWQPGESGELVLPDGRSFPITAGRIEKHESGNKTWIGKYEVDGRTHVAILTYGPAGVAGEVRTPDGPLLLQTELGETLLVDTATAGMQLPQAAEDIKIPVIDPAHVDPASDPIVLKAAPSPQATVDVLVAYTHGMVTRHGSTAGARLRLDQLVATSNQAYIDSEVAITLRLVHALEVAYTDANDNGDALDDLTGGVGVLAAAQSTLRTRYGADIVVLVRPFNYPSHVGCGIAWLGGYNGTGASIGSQSNSGFAVVSDGSDVNGTGYFCQAATFPHEVGHTMGAMHDRATVTQGGTQPLQTGAYSYSYGYVHSASFSAGSGQNVCNAGAGSTCFGTIMSYLTKVSELKFSNPNLSTCAGLPCGTATENVALTLNNTRAGVAGWRATKVPFVGAMTGSGQSAQPGTGFAQPLKVTIRDATNALVPGVTVNFTAPASGASALLSATSVVTDANGVAQITASANGTAGAYAVVATATSGLVAAPFSFSLTNGSATGSALTATISGSGVVTGGGLNCPGTCSSSPAAGSTVTLSATPSAGMVFTGWLGHACTGTGSCVVTMNGAANVSATFAPSSTMPVRFDVDLNQSYDALTDGVMIVRHLFGITGATLTNGAVGPGAQRSAAAIPGFLANITPQLDVDGDGRADALTDGMLVVRYLFGLRGAPLISGAIGPGATRTTAAQVEAYIAARLP